MSTTPSQKQIASKIDHTLLKADATELEIDTLCEEAVQYGCAAVCVNSSWVAACRGLLTGSPIGVCSVVGFPLGAMSTRAKVEETRQAIRDGATEIDMVIHLGALREGNVAYLLNDIKSVAAVCHEEFKSLNSALPVPVVLKAILEIGSFDPLHRDTLLLTACRCAEESGVDFVKGGTGMYRLADGSVAVATLEQVRLMRQSVGSSVRIKAAGGIRTRKDALLYIEVGADRMGTSNLVPIMKECEAQGQLDEGSSSAY